MTAQPAVQQEIPEMASEVFSAEVMHVTPELAQQWLGLNSNNRHPSDRSVMRYRSDMREGQWIFTGDSIRFDRSGKLLDGQHRLMALASLEGSGLSLPFVVMRGIDQRAQLVMDQGRKRSHADQLTLKGYRHTSLLASGVRLYLVHRAGLLYSDRKRWDEITTFPKVDEWLTANPWAQSAADNLYRCFNGRSYKFTPSVSFAAGLMFWQVNPDWSYKYFHALKEGGVAVEHPANQLRNWALGHDNEKLSARDELALLIEHFNKSIAGKKMRMVPKWRTHEDGETKSKYDNPLNFPKVNGLDGLA